MKIQKEPENHIQSFSYIIQKEPVILTYETPHCINV